MGKFVVGVMGSGDDKNPHLMETARTLGRLIAEQGWVLLSGGRDSGVMKAANEGAKQISGSLTIGILPDLQSTVSPDVDVVIVTDMGNARNNINVLSSDVIVACGQGGPGTASEIALALKAGKPVILLAAALLTRSYFQDLGKEQVLIADSPTEAIAHIKKYLHLLFASDPELEQRSEIQ